MSKQISLVIVLLIIAGFISMALVLLGKIPAIVFSVASIGGLIFWLLTTYKTPIDTKKIIVPYLLAVLFFIIHVYEEYLTDFEVAMTDITGFHMLEMNFLTVAAFVAPALWVTGAILLIRKTHVGYYFLSFFFIAMTMAELAHFVFPFLEDGTFHYVSGMYTAALPLVPAGYGMYVTIKEIQRIQQKPESDLNEVV